MVGADTKLGVMVNKIQATTVDTPQNDQSKRVVQVTPPIQEVSEKQSMRQTQIVFSSEGGNVHTQMKIRDETMSPPNKPPRIASNLQR